MLENYVSLLFGIVEILFFSGIGFGFPFIQYVFEDEFIFYKETCGNEESFDTKVLCEAAKQQYNTVFTSAIVGNTIGTMLLGLVQQKWGIFAARLIGGVSTTTGLVLFIFYSSTAYILYPAMILLVSPACVYLVTNFSITPVFPSIASAMMVVISGFFDASAGIFLIFKLMSDTFPLRDMFVVLAICSLLLHVRTFFLMPYDFVPEDVDNFSLFKSSFVGRLFHKSRAVIPGENPESKAESPEDGSSPNSKEVTQEDMSLKDCMKSILFWQFVIVFNILSVRMKSIQGWIYPWMDWTFSDISDSGQVVSDALDFYGYFVFASPVVATIPGLIFKLISKGTKSNLKGDFYGFLVILTVTVLGSTIISAQMCHKATEIEDTANAIAFVVIFCVCKTILYATPGVFLFMFFPVRHMSTLYGLVNLPGIVLMWINDPLYKLILNGSDIGDAEFCPISIGFAVISAVCILSVFYTLFDGRKRLKLSKTTEKVSRL